MFPEVTRASFNSMTAEVFANVCGACREKNAPGCKKCHPLSRVNLDGICFLSFLLTKEHNFVSVEMVAVQRDLQFSSLSVPFNACLLIR